MSLIVAPLHEVEAVLAARRPSHLISLASPGHEAVAFAGQPSARLDLRFNDIAEPREGLLAPADGHVRALLDFAEAWTGGRPLLIHCWAGVSRSTAAAYVIACARSEPGLEEAWAQRLRRAAPFATPNRLMVALADQRLGRGGAMSRAVAAIGRGEAVSMGRWFELDLGAPA